MIRNLLGFFMSCLVILSLTQGNSGAENLNWKALSTEIEKEIAGSEERSARVYRQIERERKALLEEIAGLEARAESLKNQVEVLKGEFERFRTAEEELRRDISEQQSEVVQIHKQILSWQDDLARLFDRNPLVIYHNSLENLRTKLNDPEYTVTMEDIVSLTDALLTEIVSGGLVEKIEIPVYGDDGQKRNVKALRVGTFCIFAFSEDDIRLVRIGPDNSFLLSGFTLPGEIRQAVKAYFNGDAEFVPVDISGKKTCDSLPESRANRLIRWFRSGGMIMWPLLLIAVISTVICLERVWFYRRQKSLSEDAWNLIVEALRSRAWDRCHELCQRLRYYPVARIVNDIVLAYSARVSSNPGRIDMLRIEDIVDEALFRETGYLNRFLSTLTTMASVAPLLGLLGTVCGIIETFQMITLVGTGNPRYLSSGISEALVTTQFGLMIAVPVIVAHHFLEKWAERLTTEAEEKSSQVCGILMQLEQEGVYHEGSN